MKRSVAMLLLYFVCFYVVAYCALYHFRKPAANLGYWAYTGDYWPDSIERCIYYAFYPLYVTHQRFLGGHRHTWDRPEPYWPPNFQG
jgi:hypothetical protein